MLRQKEHKIVLTRTANLTVTPRKSYTVEQVLDLMSACKAAWDDSEDYDVIRLVPKDRDRPGAKIANVGSDVSSYWQPIYPVTLNAADARIKVTHHHETEGQPTPNCQTCNVGSTRSEVCLNGHASYMCAACLKRLRDRIAAHISLA
jgi:hypothetical protein